jgi:uncharacterized protein (TIGR02452 family)
VALNFASAHRPGGGFLNGARAQEESLARSSTLYETLEGQGFYDFNSRSGGLYTDAMVYSPTVYVFRDDTGALLDEPWEGAFITSPAVNVSSGIRDPGLVQGTMYERARKVMALAYAKGHRRLVLGAWGCGVFGNDPGTIAGIFRAHLQGEYRGAFEAVTFAISGGHALPEFQRVFSAVY